MVEFCLDNGVTLLPYGTVAGGMLSERYLGMSAAEASKVTAWGLTLWGEAPRGLQMTASGLTLWGEAPRGLQVIAVVAWGNPAPIESCKREGRWCLHALAQLVTTSRRAFAPCDVHTCNRVTASADDQHLQQEQVRICH